jgi:general secretion pathway protein G
VRLNYTGLKNSYRKRRVTYGGCTLIEVLIVVAIIGISVAIAIPTYQSYREKAKITDCKQGIKTIEKAINSYMVDNENYPDSLANVGCDGMRDPWGNPYQYLKIAGADNKGVGGLRKDRNLVPINTDYDLYSMGPDGKSAGPLTAKASRDDIIRANDGQYIGPASEY